MSALAGGAAFVSIALVVATLIREKPVPGVTWLLLAGIPVLIVGQLWSMAVLFSRNPKGVPPGDQRKWRIRVGGERDPRRFLFDGLPIRQANALLVIAFLGLVSAMATVPALAAGGPTSPSRHCRYRLDNHGSITCVSHNRYVFVAGAQQRFADSIFAGAFVLQAGMGAAELARRRRPEANESAAKR